VKTDMTTKDKVPAYAWVSKETVVKESLEGLARNKPLVVPGPLYKLAVFGAKYLPRPVVRMFAEDAPKND